MTHKVYETHEVCKPHWVQWCRPCYMEWQKQLYWDRVQFIRWDTLDVTVTEEWKLLAKNPTPDAPAGQTE